MRVTKNREYTDDDRKQAIWACVLAGSVKSGAKSLGIPRATVMTWKKQYPDLWDRTSQEVWEAHGEEVMAAYAKTVTNGIESLFEKVYKGDVLTNAQGTVLDEAGNPKRIPIKAKELAVIVAICQDKLLLLRGRPTSITARAETTTADKLEELKQAASRGKPDLKVVEN